MQRIPFVSAALNRLVFQNVQYLHGVLASIFFIPLTGMLQANPAEDGLDFFEKQIRPILVEHCYECHAQQSKTIGGNLRLDTREGVLLGGDTGPAVVPRNIGRSLLISALRHDGLEMPPDKGQLPKSVIQDFERWVSMGAPDPREGSHHVERRTKDLELARDYWAFRPIRDPDIPRVLDPSWSVSTVDVFVLGKLESASLQPAERATKEDWCRRVFYDLHGLPPSTEQLQAFVRDDSPDIFERLVDELLSSPRYGERWGQHWLDVVRFAETEGFEYDRTIPGAWRYRDYVIRAFNTDKPYDLFVREQIAGDELQPEEIEGLIAAGFNRLGAVRRNAGNQEVAGSRNEVLTERTDIIGSALLGLTIGCARCHYHKFDPISQEDYYRLQAFFAASHESEIPLADEKERLEWNKRADPIKAQVDALKKELEQQEASEQEKTKKKIANLESQLPEPLPSISTIRNEFDKESPIHVLRRGDHALPGDRVTASPPEIFMGLFGESLGDVRATSPRTALARWLTDPRNPLTARVLANRIWQHHFGRGIVATENDFGVNGEYPSHPELLDHLATYLLKNNWQLKALHREIVLSRTYRQSSTAKSTGLSQAIDPKNALLSYFSRRRLSSEELRDSLLYVSGQLNGSWGDGSVILPVHKDLVAQLYKPSQWLVDRELGRQRKRSVYLFAKRNLRLPFMEVFDQPTAQTSCARRLQSTHAPQALELLNGTIANEMADAFADRLHSIAGEDIEMRVKSGFQAVLGRDPTVEEMLISKGYLQQVPLREFCLALFNLNEFLYVR